LLAYLRHVRYPPHSHSSRQTDAPALWLGRGIERRVSLTQRDPNSGLARHFSEDQHAPDLA